MAELETSEFPFDPNILKNLIDDIAAIRRGPGFLLHWLREELDRGTDKACIGDVLLSTAATLFVMAVIARHEKYHEGRLVEFPRALVTFNEMIQRRMDKVMARRLTLDDIAAPHSAGNA